LKAFSGFFGGWHFFENQLHCYKHYLIGNYSLSNSSFHLKTKPKDFMDSVNYFSQTFYFHTTENLAHWHKIFASKTRKKVMIMKAT